MGLFNPIPDNFISLDDTPTTYSGENYRYVRVNESGEQVYFNSVIGGTIVSGTTPPDPNEASLWYNNDDFIIYHWDSDRNEWLSNDLHNYLFTYQGNCDGLYLSIGDLRHAYAHYPIPRVAAITGIIATAEERNNSSKGFQIRNDVSVLTTFNLNNWQYSDMSASINLDQDTKLKVYCVSAGGRCRNPAVTIEVRWRYTP